MGKYAALAAYLESRKKRQALLTLADVDEIVDGLPESARRLRTWWANSPKNHSQSKDGWLSVGWEVRTVDLGSETVLFERVRALKQGARARLQNIDLGPDDLAALRAVSTSNAVAFKRDAQDPLSNRYGALLIAEHVPPIPRRFDFVSAYDGRKVVGDAKLFAKTDGRRVATSKLAPISETVWLLQHVAAKNRFIVFGGERRVPEAWLRQFGQFADGVAFHFLDAKGELLDLKPAKWVSVVGDAANG